MELQGVKSGPWDGEGRGRTESGWLDYMGRNRSMWWHWAEAQGTISSLLVCLLIHAWESMVRLVVSISIDVRLCCGIIFQLCQDALHYVKVCYICLWCLCWWCKDVLHLLMLWNIKLNDAKMCCFCLCCVHLTMQSYLCFILCFNFILCL